MDIQIDEDVRKMVMEQGCDFRICTACYGPALVTTAVKPAKESDIRIPVGDHTIFVSRYQAPYITRITMDMVYDEDEIDSCPAFYVRRRYRSLRIRRAVLDRAQVMVAVCTHGSDGIVSPLFDRTSSKA